MLIDVVNSRAPVRVDFFGGWTDLPLFTQLCSGRVINAAVTLYTYASVRKRGPHLGKGSVCGYQVTTEIPDTSIIAYSEDFDELETVPSVAQIEYNGTLDLIKAACKRLRIEGIEIRTRSDAPAGSGLGTSASLAVAVIGALTRFANQPWTRSSMADLAYRLEVEELKLLSGTQDQYIAAHGGVALLKHYGENVHYEPLQLPLDLLMGLEKRIVLVYTGKARLSTDIHRYVHEKFDSGGNHRAIKGLRDTTKHALRALLGSDLNRFGELMNENWAFQKEMHPKVTNDSIDEAFIVAKENGAIGGKACGAGGGGCLVFLARMDKEHELKVALKELGLEILSFHIDTLGLCTWTDKTLQEV